MREATAIMWAVDSRSSRQGRCPGHEISASLVAVRPSLMAGSPVSGTSRAPVAPPLPNCGAPAFNGRAAGIGVGAREDERTDASLDQRTAGPTASPHFSHKLAHRGSESARVVVPQRLP